MNCTLNKRFWVKIPKIEFVLNSIINNADIFINQLKVIFSYFVKIQFSFFYSLGSGWLFCRRLFSTSKDWKDPF